jgi:ABC-2 type transport system permease protein
MRTLYFALLLLLQFFKSRLSFRLDLLIELLSTGVIAASGLLFVYLLMDGDTVQSLNGWSRDEVFLIYGYSLLPTGLFNIIGPNLYRFPEKYIIEGQFDRILLRPLPSLMQVLSESFYLESIPNFAIGIFVFFSAASRLGLDLSFLDLLWLLVWTMSGAIILLSVFVTLSSLSFHFEDRFGVVQPAYHLISFGRYPLPIYHVAIQFFLTWIIPYGFVAFYPATYFLGRQDFILFAFLTPVMALVTGGIAVTAWRFGVSRYSSAGS